MKKVVKKYDKGGAKPKGVSKQVASVTGLPEGSYVAKSKAVTKPAVKTITKAPVKKNAAVGKATAYKTEKRTYVDPSSPAYSKLSAKERNENTANQVRKSTGTPLYYSTGTKVAYNKKNNTKTIVNYKADGTKQTKVINYSKPATAKKAPVKTPVKQPVKTAYDVLKDKQTAVKNPRVGTPVKGTVTTNPKKTVTVKKSTVKPAAVKAVEEQVTPLAFKKVSDFAPIKSTASSTTSSAPKSTVSKTTPDRVKAPVNKPTVSMGERLTGYKGTSKPVASTTTSAPTSTIPTPTESTPGRVSLIDRIKGNIAKRKMKRMAKLSEQVGQSRAMGTYAQPAMKKGGTKKYAKGGFPDLNKDGEVTKADILKGRGVIARKGGTVKKLVKAQYGISTTKGSTTKKPLYNPAKIKVTSSKKKPSYNEVFKTKKK